MAQVEVKNLTSSWVALGSSSGTLGNFSVEFN